MDPGGGTARGSKIWAEEALASSGVGGSDGELGRCDIEDAGQTGEEVCAEGGRGGAAASGRSERQQLEARIVGASATAQGGLEHGGVAWSRGIGGAAARPGVEESFRGASVQIRVLGGVAVADPGRRCHRAHGKQELGSGVHGVGDGARDRRMEQRRDGAEQTATAAGERRRRRSRGGKD